MKEASGIVKLSIPFVAGVGIGAFFPLESTFGGLVLLCGIAAMIFTAVRGNSFLPATARPDIRLPSIFVLYLLAGLFCSHCAAIVPDISTPERRPLLRCALGFRDNLSAVIGSIPYRDTRTSAVINALLTGDRSGLTSETIRTFRNSGASHILALSGLHLGVIYSILLLLLRPLGNTPYIRLVKYCTVICLTGFYTLGTGAGPSLARAFLFILLNETAKITGRSRNPVNIYCAAITIQLIFNPSAISSIGFQLSYLAMAGIVFLLPVLKDWYPVDTDGPHTYKKAIFRINVPEKLWELIAVSLSCQIFTAPLVWFRFRTFPSYFLLTNLIALPLVSTAIPLSVTAIILTKSGICPEILVKANECLISLMLHSLEIISSM